MQYVRISGGAQEDAEKSLGIIRDVIIKAALNTTPNESIYSIADGFTILCSTAGRVSPRDVYLFTPHNLRNKGVPDTYTTIITAPDVSGGASESFPAR